MVETSEGAAPANAPAPPGVVADLLELAKPRLTLMVVITSGIGYLVGLTRIPASRDLTTPEIEARIWTFLAVITGTALLGAAANALNQWWERTPDSLMDRTSNRPFPGGRLKPAIIVPYSIILVISGVLLLARGGNDLAAGFGIASLVTYVLIYTPLKRRSTVNTLVGAIPGALPPLIGWSAAQASIDLGAIGLFAILFFWQVPHFLAIAWLYRDDYAKAGFRMLPVVDPDGKKTGRMSIVYSLALLASSLLPTLVGIGGWIYLAVAVGAGSKMIHAAIRLERQRDRDSARSLFLTSLLYLPLVLLTLVLDPTAP